MLNNDAYNFAIEKYGYERIDTEERITRDSLGIDNVEVINKIIEEKQKYFLKEWMPYRLIINDKLLKIIVKYNKEKCYIWTKADKSRATEMFNYYKLDRYFNKIIFDSKLDVNHLICMIQEKTKCSKLIIYENDVTLFLNEKCERVLQDINFTVHEYVVS